MRPAIVLLLCLCSRGEAFAWGQEGHSIIAEIAQRRLTSASTAKVEEVLGHGHSLASIASWADDFRAGPDGKKTSNWHFANIPLVADHYDDNYCPLDTTYGDCTVAELKRLKHDLHCAPPEAKDNPQVAHKALTEALKFAVYFVGDIHQPLHTLSDELGGNKVEVGIYMRGNTCPVPKPGSIPKCDPSATIDLHTVWDTTLIERQYYDWGAYVDDLEEHWLSAPEAQAVDDTTPDQWATETHQQAQIVWRMTPPNHVLDDAYLKNAIGIINRQLGIAGLRLARFLNEAYAPTTSCEN
jgi:hypothetical protein